MAEIEEFLSQGKSMIIAPAGYGKTHSITECLRLFNGNKRCLILTHTHAGVASIKEKMIKEGINPSKYIVDTICSFALEYTNAFVVEKQLIPDAENGVAYFNFAIEKATKLVQSNPVKAIIKCKYDHLVVDEYQDCTQSQHQLIVTISNIIPTHILGDPLQGIFEFRDSILVNMESQEEMFGFIQNMQELNIPWRWSNYGSLSLGSALESIRRLLIIKQPINLNDYVASIELLIEPENNYTVSGSAYKQVIWREINDVSTKSLLLIHPVSTSVEPRIKFLQQFNALRLIESIDDKNFYKFAKYFDSQVGEDLIKRIIDFSHLIFSKTVVDNWFNDNGKLKNKRLESDRVIQASLQIVISKLLSLKSLEDIACLLKKINILPDNKCYRKDLLNDTIKALSYAHIEGLSTYEAMTRSRDFVRRQGRRIAGRCIGTTLLTKGLEFDVVIVLNAHKFESPKHLYVALTRACKKLIVISQNPILNPY